MTNTFYFYVIHDFLKPHKMGTIYENFNYLDQVEKAFNSNLLMHLEAANAVHDYLINEAMPYELDNGLDVRSLRFTGEIKQTNKSGYETILADDIRIMSRMSEKSKNLLIKFGFNLDGWHRPFKIEAENEQDLNDQLVNKFGFMPEIIWKDM